MYPDSDAIAHPTAGQLVADNIRRKIILGEFRDGDFLPNEAQLLEQYQVSRPVLREAIRILQSESMLTIRRGSKGGARVNAPRPGPVARLAGGLLQYEHTTVFDVFRARAIIEPPAVRLLAENRTPQTIQQLREALEREADAIGEPRRWGRVHAEFHTLVVELSGSNTLALFADIMAEITMAHTQAVWQRALDDADKRRCRTGPSGASQAGAVGRGRKGRRRRDAVAAPSRGDHRPDAQGPRPTGAPRAHRITWL